jgi:hypothetical protein
MAKVNEQIGNRQASAPFSAARDGGLGADITTLVACINEALVAAESASGVRTSIGRSSRLVARVPALHDLLLRTLAFIFKDQRNVNAALVEAVRTSLQLNIRLCENLDRIRLQLDDLQRSNGERRDPNEPTA